MKSHRIKFTIRNMESQIAFVFILCYTFLGLILKWRGSMKKYLNAIENEELNRTQYYLLYIGMFLITFTGCFWYFIIMGKSFIGNTIMVKDSLTQHFPFLMYYGEYLRSFFHALFVEHKLQISLFDMSLGYGDDIINTLSYYVIGDPFAFLAVFVPKEMTEGLYGILIIARLFFAGVSFSVYCRYHNLTSAYTLVGSMIYVFSGYALLTSVGHPYFINPMIWLPIIFMAMDKIMQKEGGKLQYIFLIALTGLSNFYFFYMICLLIVIYAIFDYVYLHKKLVLNEILKEIGSFIVYSILGVGMSGVIFLPAMINIVSVPRLTVEKSIPILYEMGYYLKLIANFVSSTLGTHYERMGYTAIGAFAVVLLFTYTGKNRGVQRITQCLYHNGRMCMYSVYWLNI